MSSGWVSNTRYTEFPPNVVLLNRRGLRIRNDISNTCPQETTIELTFKIFWINHFSPPHWSKPFPSYLKYYNLYPSQSIPTACSQTDSSGTLKSDLKTLQPDWFLNTLWFKSKSLSYSYSICDFDFVLLWAHLLLSPPCSLYPSLTGLPALLWTLTDRLLPQGFPLAIPLSLYVGNVWRSTACTASM